MIRSSQQRFKGDSKVIRQGNPFSQTDPIVAFLNNHSKLEQTDRHGRLYSSEAGFCSRKAYFNATLQFESTFDISNHFYTKIGNAIHDVVKAAFKNSNALLAEEAKVPDVGLNLGGYIDIVAEVSGITRVVEIKSCGKLPTVPKLDHYAQAHLYSALSGLPVTILYVSRNVASYDGKLQTAIFNYEQADPKPLFNAILASLAVSYNVTPEVPFDADSQCRHCPHFDKCWPFAISDHKGAELARLKVQAAKQTRDMLKPGAITRRRNQFLGGFTDVRANGSST